MGKNLRHKNACSPIQNHPGFMWGLFNILKHNHWRYIKKRLPHKRLVGRRHAVGTRNEGNDRKPSTDGVSPSTSKTEDNSYVESGQRSTKPNNHQEKLKKPNAGEKLKKHNSEDKSQKHHSQEKSKKHNSEEKSRKTNSEIKKSVKALIKALVSEDKSKRNSRHRRSSTYPVQSNSIESESLHHIERSDENSSNVDHTGVFNQAGGVSPAIGSLNPLFLMSEESSSSDSEEFKVEDIPADAEGNDSDVKERDSKKKNRDKKAWYDPKLIHNKEIMENDDTSPRQSKACLDALNLIHMNRNFLLKVLQDPGSPLARHFHSQQAFSARTVLTKARSFPLPGSPTKRDSQPNDHNVLLPKGDGDQKDSSIGFDRNFPTPCIAAEYRADGIQKLNETMAKVADEDSSGCGYTRKRGKNQVVVKRFKDLRQKIRHVINDHKNEKHRITMDAVLDKVPRKHGFSKDLRQDIFYQLKGQSINRSRKEGSKLKQIRRTSSLGGSLDRYLQLYECSFQRDPKNQISEKSQPEVEESVLPSRPTPKTLGRILSLPEMKSCSFKIEESPEKQLGQFASSSTPYDQEQDDLEIPGVSVDWLDASIERESQEDIGDATEKDSSATDNQLELTSASNSEGKAEREMDHELMLDTELHHDQATEPVKRFSDESSEDSPCLKRTFSFDEKPPEVSISQAEDSEAVQHDPGTDIVAETASFANKESESVAINVDVQVEAQEKAKFNYVRDILEMSGFSTTESLSTWHSDYQPLDPSVYEEVTTGCMIQDPECWGNEEGGNCYHLLLFDLINEVLIEIYERSYHYSPMPLSSLCRIHPMPVGYSVLKDVWVRISGYLRCKPQDGQPLDYLMSRDLSESDGWMDELTVRE